MTEILAADYYVNNARLFEAAAKLWVKPDDVVVDPTYGKGGFYKRYRPTNLDASDLDPAKGVKVRDFRLLLDVPDCSADVFVFDPAYVTPGGRETSTIETMNDAYGMATAEATLQAQWTLIVHGMMTGVRVLKPGGVFMQKVMPYISSGRYQNYPFMVTQVMREWHLEVVDQFMLVKRGAGPQPKNRTRKCHLCKGIGVIEGKTYPVIPAQPDVAWSKDADRVCAECSGTGKVATTQQHARNNYSVLIVARKGK